MPRREEGSMVDGAYRPEATAAAASSDPKPEELPGVFGVLVREHQEALAITERISAAEDPSKRADLWDELRACLLAHERGEQQEVFKVVENYPDLAHVLSEHGGLGDRLLALIAQLESLPLVDVEWPNPFSRLATTLRQHIEREERELFPLTLASVGVVRAEALRALYLSDRTESQLTPNY